MDNDINKNAMDNIDYKKDKILFIINNYCNIIGIDYLKYYKKVLYSENCNYYSYIIEYNDTYYIKYNIIKIMLIFNKSNNNLLKLLINPKK